MSAQIINFRPEGAHEWSQFAACAKAPVPNMFPHDGDTRATTYAKSVCAACPVRLECLTEALDSGETHGVWGGLSPEERLSVRRNNVRRATKTGADRLTADEMAQEVLDAAAAAEDHSYALDRAARKVNDAMAAHDFNEMLDAAQDYEKALA